MAIKYATIKNQIAVLNHLLIIITVCLILCIACVGHKCIYVYVSYLNPNLSVLFCVVFFFLISFPQEPLLGNTSLLKLVPGIFFIGSVCRGTCSLQEAIFIAEILRKCGPLKHRISKCPSARFRKQEMLVQPQLQASTVISIFQIKRGYFSLPYTHACLNFNCIILSFLKDTWLKKEVYFFMGI